MTESSNTSLQRKLLWTHPFILMTATLFTVLSACTVWIFVSASTRISQEAGIAAVLMSVRIMQVTLGLLVGLALILIGVVMSWLGVTAPLESEFGTQQVQGKLVTASPGVLLFICGTVVIVVALTQELHVQEGGMHQLDVVGTKIEADMKMESPEPERDDFEAKR